MSASLHVVRLAVFAAAGLSVVSLCPAPALAQVAPVPTLPGPFGAAAQPVPTVNLAPGADLGLPTIDVGQSADATAISASTDSGPAAMPPDPSTEIAPAIALLETTSPPTDATDTSPSLPGGDAGTTSLEPGPGPRPGPLPLPGPVVGPPLPGPGVAGPMVGIPNGPGGLTGPGISSPNPRPVPTSVLPTTQSSTTRPTTPELQAQAKIPEWLKKVLSPAVFLAWLLELLPLLLRALLAGLAALLSALVLPPGGVVWRLPPELTHQLGGIGQAHAVLVQLADAALAVMIALIGFGHLAGPHAGLPVLPPRAVAPRVAVGVLVNHGSLAVGSWIIDLHNALLGAVTPSGLVGFDPGAWLQSGLGGLVLGVLYALVGLLLALGGWLRVALVDVLLLAAPVLAVLWVLPLTAEWGEWALRLFGNLLAGQWLQVLALWLGGQLLLAPAPDLGTALGKSFAALGVLLSALWLPGLLPGPRGAGVLQVLFGFALARHAVRAVRGDGDRVRGDFERRKELERKYEAEHPRPPLRVQVVSSRRRPAGSSA